MWFVATITLRRFVAGSGRRPPHHNPNCPPAALKLSTIRGALQAYVSSGQLRTYRHEGLGPGSADFVAKVLLHSSSKFILLYRRFSCKDVGDLIA